MIVFVEDKLVLSYLSRQASLKIRGIFITTQCTFIQANLLVKHIFLALLLDDHYKLIIKDLYFQTKFSTKVTKNKKEKSNIMISPFCKSFL